jgi:hypothetical protein
LVFIMKAVMMNSRPVGMSEPERWGIRENRHLRQLLADRQLDSHGLGKKW